MIPGLERLALNVDSPVRVALRHPGTGQIIPNSWVEVLSFDAERVRQATVAFLRGNVGVEFSQERLYDTQCAAAITGWDIRQLDGSPLPPGTEFPYSPENAKLLMGDMSFVWIRDQVLIQGRDRGNYLPGA